MPNALFAFDDPQVGRRAAQQLIDAGLPRSAVQIHGHETPPGEQTSRRIDEQVTGGLVSNVIDLFRGVLEWGASPHDASAYEETVRRGGVVVGVDAASDAEQTRTDELMQAAGCSLRTDWRSAPTGSEMRG